MDYFCEDLNVLGIENIADDGLCRSGEHGVGPAGGIIPGNSTVTHADLKELLAQFGEVHGVFLKPETIWALARVVNEEDAWKIMKELHGENFQGRKLIVRKAEKGKARKSLPKPVAPTEPKPSIQHESPHNTPGGSSKGQPRVVYISQQHGKNRSA